MSVRVQPGARRDEVRGWMESGELRVAVSAAPERGRANQAVAELLAQALGLNARAVKLTRGATARRKTFEIEGLDQAAIRHRLDAAIAAARE